MISQFDLPPGPPPPAVVAQAQAGDPGAFSAIYRAYYPRIVRHCARLVGDAVAAEDFAQDTFLKAYLALPHTPGELHLAGWLFRIATNTVRSALRHERCHPCLPLFEGYPAPDGGSDSVAAADDRAVLRAALRPLPPDQAALLLLRLHHGLSYDELAARCGTTPNAAKMRCCRARQAVRGMRNEG